MESMDSINHSYEPYGSCKACHPVTRHLPLFKATGIMALESKKSMKSMDSMESMDSMDSMDSMESMEPMDSMDSMEPMDSMESMEPLDLCSPAARGGQ